MKKTIPAASPGLALAGRLENPLVDAGILHAFALIHIMPLESWLQEKFGGSR